MLVLSPASEIYRRYKLGEQLIDWYEPLPGQKEAYLSTKKIQMFEGGNRSGKTETMVAKIVNIMLGKHPTIKRVLPVKARIIGTVLKQGSLGVILNKIRRFIPVSSLRGRNWEKGYNGERMMVTLQNRSTLQLMADTQDIQYHRGEDLDVVGIDEECKEEIFDENVMRLADRNGLMLLAMTPHNGITWSYKKLVKASQSDPSIGYYHFKTLDNYTIDREELIKASYSMFSEKEYEIRILGKRIMNEGLVYPTYSTLNVCNPFRLPDETQLVLGVDFGYTNPHAGSLRALLPKGQEVGGTSSFVCGEYYETGYTVTENGYKMGCWLREKWPGYKVLWVVCDPRSGSQTDKQTGERDVDVFRRAFYSGYGQQVPIRMGRTDKGCVEHRINIVNEELLPDINGIPKLKIFSTCVHHLDEIESYIYKSKRDEELNRFTKPKEMKNHCMNAMEYVSEAKPRHFVRIDKPLPYLKYQAPGVYR